jgi:hypothetical protein
VGGEPPPRPRAGKARGSGLLEKKTGRQSTKAIEGCRATLQLIEPISKTGRCQGRFSLLIVTSCRLSALILTTVVSVEASHDEKDGF